MDARWHRAVAGLGVALAGALLTGCHAQGTFEVLSEERVAVDVVVTGADVNCPHGADALKLTVTTTIDQYGDQVCHVTGETQATYFSPFGITVSPAAEYLVLQANLSGGTDSWPAADIDVRFPGKVMDASLGSVSGNVVRITDLGALTQGSGLHAVGLASPGPPRWMVAAAAGTGAGIAATLITVLTVVMVRRRRRRQEVPAPLDQAAFLEPEPEVATSLPDQLAVVAAAEPVPPASAGAPPPRLEDTSWFARPPVAGEPTNGKAVNGAVANGTATNGALSNGTATNGPATNGAATKGAGSSGAAGSHGLPAAPARQHSAWARPPEASGDHTAG